jgi:hypothetical protein
MMKVNLKLSVLIALLGLAIFICIPHTWAQDKDDKDEKGKGDNEVQRGFEIAPVALNLKHKDRDLVGLGSYIVNSQGGCNDCHTCPSYDPNDNPYVTGQGRVNATNYLAGGVAFGPFVSKNITPDASGKPHGLTFEQFEQALRTGIDPDDGGMLQVMPWPVYRHMTEHDLRAIYEYLSAIPHAEPGSCGGPGQ